MKFDVIILAGGKGSRSADPEVPKSVQELSSTKRVIDTIAESLPKHNISTVCAAFGFGQSLQEDAFQKALHPLQLVWTSSVGRGTSHAAVNCLPVLNSETVMVIAGDSAISAPLGELVRKFLEVDADLAFFARFSDHPGDSDSVETDERNRILAFSPKGTTQPGRPKLSLSGVLVVRRHLLSRIKPDGDLQACLLELSLRENLRAYAFPTRYFLRDTGTRERLDKAIQSFRSGAMFRRGQGRVGALFLDRDGTLVPDRGDARTKIEAVELDAQVLSELLETYTSGVPWFIVTNQPGIAKGKITRDDVEKTFRDLQNVFSGLGFSFDGYSYCPHHPDAGWKGEVAELKIQCDCRKPAVGMMSTICNEHGIDPSKSFVIGDSWRDEELARSLNSRFLLARHEVPGEVAQAIRYARRQISC